MLNLFIVSTTCQHIWAESILHFLHYYIQLNTKYLFNLKIKSCICTSKTTKLKLYYAWDIIRFIHKILQHNKNVSQC